MNGLPKAKLAIGVVTLAVLVSACGGSSSSSSQSARTPLTLGLEAPFTGARAVLGQGMQVGAKLALAEINASGGVLGHPLQLAVQDDAADPADAAPAAATLINVDHAVAIIGPPALTAGVVLSQAQKARIPMFCWGGGSQFDNNTNPFFFRMSPSDSEQGDAMVVFAHSKGFSRISLAFGASSASQSLVPPILAAAKKLNITVVANVSFTAGQSSYRSEISNVFAGNPQVILSQFNEVTAGTVFGEVNEQGLLSTPWIGSNLWYTSTFFQSLGAKVASGNIYLTNSSAAGGLGSARFLSLLQSKDNLKAPPNGSEFAYDGIMVWALGADQAGGWDWPTIRSGILTNSGPPGTTTGTYSEAYKLLQQHKKIDWQGAGSSTQFDKYDNVFGPFDLLKYTSTGSTTTGGTLSAQQIQNALK